MGVLYNMGCMGGNGRKAHTQTPTCYNIRDHLLLCSAAVEGHLVQQLQQTLLEGIGLLEESLQQVCHQWQTATVNHFTVLCMTEVGFKLISIYFHPQKTLKTNYWQNLQCFASLSEALKCFKCKLKQVSSMWIIKINQSHSLHHLFHLLHLHKDSIQRSYISVFILSNICSCPSFISLIIEIKQ